MQKEVFCTHRAPYCYQTGNVVVCGNAIGCHIPDDLSVFGLYSILLLSDLQEFPFWCLDMQFPFTPHADVLTIGNAIWHH